MSRIQEGRNSASDEEAASFLDKYEELQDKIEALKVEHMNKCRAVRAEMVELLDDAKSQGIAKGDIKDVAKARALRKKLHDLLTDRDEDSQVKGILEALGDDFASFGLGAAAVEREEDDDEESDDRTKGIVDAVKESATDDEWDAAGPAGALN